MKGENAMPRNKKLPKRPILKKGPKYAPEHEEILDSGLSILANMIVETHLKRIREDPEYQNKLRKDHNPEATK
jgi:hypothetical protein